ncbi:MAG: precorrin-6A synthase (deacetylating) [Halocynthiibacter sp.]
MLDLILIGIGTGNPDHLTRQAVKALNGADLILIPYKGSEKADLAALRREICDDILTSPTPIEEFKLPVRDPAIEDYIDRVNQWHDAIAQCWLSAMDAHPTATRVALLVWGDPSLYDSTLRIAHRVNEKRATQVEVIPGITSMQGLTAAHRIPLNALGGPFTVTTGRQLRDHGWPQGVDRLVVMLDGDCAFQTLDPAGIHIWWGGFVGMENEVIRSGPLAEISQDIIDTRAGAKSDHGWIMDIYILDRAPQT